MFTRVVVRRLGLMVLGVSFLFVWVCRGQGQGQLINEGIKKEFDNNTAYKSRQELISGQRWPQGAEDQKLMDVMAKWYVQRVTMIPVKTDPDKMAKVHEDLENSLIVPLLYPGAAKGNRAFVDQLGKHMAKSLEQVLTLDFAVSDNRVAIINAALMLPAVARLKQEDVGDLLVKLLNDPKRHDAIKLHAARAMREFFPAHMVDFGDDQTDPKVKLKFKRDTERLQALVNFIERREWPTAEGGDREVIRYLRREAITSLAHVEAPVLWALKKKEVEGPAAYALLKVLVKGKGAYQPPPSLSERVEAALGLCQLKDNLARDGGYDPSVAVYAVGLCFLDYATEYSKDHVNIQSRKGKNPSKDSKIPTMAWKIQSERFILAANDLVANTKGNPAAKASPAHANALKLKPEITRIAETIKGYNPVQNDLKDFGDLVKSMAPTSGQLYKSKEPQIDPASLQGAAGPVDGN